MATKTSTVKADNPKQGMTAIEIIQALQSAAGDAHPKVRVTMKGRITAIEFEERS